jgi:SAM-dependent methyltransferase
MHTITIGGHSVSWSDTARLWQYLKMQRAVIDTTSANSSRLDGVGIELSGLLSDNVQAFYSHQWDKLCEIGVYDGLPENPRVLDVGSGVGFIDVAAYQYLGGAAKFFLLDRDSLQSPDSDYSEDYTFYHSWATTRDVLASSGIAYPGAFVLLDQGQTRLWPGDLDLITSYASWCWHYPLSTYWTQALASLKIGGRLVLEISTEPVRPVGAETTEQVIDRISDDLGSRPVIRFPMSPNGLRCVWIRAE